MTTEIETVAIEPTADAPETETVETTENQEATTEATEKPPELTLEEKYRKAENKIRHDREKIAKARAKAERLAGENASISAELTRLKAERENKAAEPAYPKMEDFDSVELYVQAVAKHEAQSHNRPAPKEAGLTPQQQQEQIAVQARLRPVTVDANGEPMAAIDVEAAKFAELVPDAAEAFEEAMDTLRDLPQHTQRMLVLAQNGPQAVYNLHKEGRLEYLGYLPPEIAALEIQRAGSTGARAAVSKAPTPIAAAKGNVAGVKSPDNMSSKELMKWVNS